ncbi:MAG: hypothetical protein WA919_01800 [Coleofasciculaceae cyanobacterium]
MSNPFIGVRISQDLNEAVLARMKQTGQSKSEVVIAALKSYLGISSPQERLEVIEQRLLALEEIAGVVESLGEAKPQQECHRSRARENQNSIT